MLDSPKKAVKVVLGTCREAAENFKYDNLVAKYGEAVAEALITQQLEESGLTIEKFRIYKDVKAVVQNGGLDIAKAHNQARQLAAQALANL